MITNDKLIDNILRKISRKTNVSDKDLNTIKSILTSQFDVNKIQANPLLPTYCEDGTYYAVCQYVEASNVYALRYGPSSHLNMLLDIDGTNMNQYIIQFEKFDYKFDTIKILYEWSNKQKKWIEHAN